MAPTAAPAPQPPVEGGLALLQPKLRPEQPGDAEASAPRALGFSD